jgi:hypothetical protein
MVLNGTSGDYQHVDNILLNGRGAFATLIADEADLPKTMPGRFSRGFLNIMAEPSLPTR